MLKKIMLLVGHALVKAANGTLLADVLSALKAAEVEFLGPKLQPVEDLAAAVAVRILNEPGRTAVSAIKTAVDAERRHNESVFGKLPPDLHQVMMDRTRKQAERAEAIRNEEEVVQVEDGIEYRVSSKRGFDVPTENTKAGEES